MTDVREMVSVRYMVDDVPAAVAFYTERLGFSVLNNFPAFADVARGNLRLLLSGPQSSAGRPMPVPVEGTVVLDWAEREIVVTPDAHSRPA